MTFPQPPPAIHPARTRYAALPLDQQRELERARRNLQHERRRRQRQNDPATHIPWLTFHLILLAPVLSVGLCIYTIVASLFFILIYPALLLYRCTKRSAALKTQYYPTDPPGDSEKPSGRASIQRGSLSRFLIPGISLHLRLIYSRQPHSTSACRTVLVNILSPLPSIFISLAALTASSFYLFAAILGNPSLKKQAAPGVGRVLHAPESPLSVVGWTPGRSWSGSGARDADWEERYCGWKFDADDGDYECDYIDCMQTQPQPADDDEDGIKAVLAVRRWWEVWLLGL